MSSIPLPALAVRPPEQQNPLSGLMQVMQIKSMMQGQQMQQQEMQIRQQQIQDMQTMQGLARSGKYVKKDDQGNVVGFDYDKFGNDATSAGVSPDAISKIQAMRKNAADTVLTEAEAKGKTIDNLEKINKQAYERLEGIRGVQDPGQRQQLYQQAAQWAQQNGVNVSQLPAQVPDDSGLNLIEGMIGMHAQSLADNKTRQETATGASQEAKNKAETASEQAKQKFYQNNPQMGAPGVPAETVQMADFLRKNPGKTPADYSAWKAAQEAKETQPYKLQLSAAEAAAHQAIQGMAVPVYAYNENGQKELMDRTSAMKKGYKTLVPVTENQVTEDTMLNNRLADVRQKIARYEMSLKKPLQTFDQGRMASLLSSDRFKIGAFGTELPTGRANAALNSSILGGLSPAARDQLIAYYNAREALVGYNRVLSGSGRSNEQALMLQMQTLPDPSISDKDFSNRAITQFRENLAIVGQGLPKIPGVKSPEEWEKDVQNPNPAGISRPTKETDPLGIRDEHPSSQPAG